MQVKSANFVNENQHLKYLKINTMKKLSLIFCGILLSLSSFAQSTKPAHFDERVDLMSVIWRLSGSQEYNLCRVPKYDQEVDSTFAQFKEHPVVELARQYQQESGISYDAVVSYALHLNMVEDIDDLIYDNYTSRDGGSFEIILDNNFLDGGDISFDRWSDEQKKAFLKPLNDFYLSSNFYEWYSKQQKLYAEVEEAFNDINKQVDYDWFNSYFGTQSDGLFRIVLSLLVGPHNYGCSAQLKDSSSVLSPVIGCCETADDGSVNYEPNLVLPIVIHEFCHHFCNRLNSQNWPLMSESAEKVFQVKAEQMTQSAYGSSLTMMNETFVRAAVIRYMVSHYPQISEESLVKVEEKSGFILTQTLCDALKQYEQQRSTYTTMSDFMPTIAKTVNDFDLKSYVKEEKKNAKLNATYKVNIKDGAKNIPSGTFTVVIKFSKPMVEGVAMNPCPSSEFPTFQGYSWPNDRTLEVKFFLKPSTQYGFTVLGSYFRTKDGHTAGKNKEINFTTGE